LLITTCAALAPLLIVQPLANVQRSNSSTPWKPSGKLGEGAGIVIAPLISQSVRISWVNAGQFAPTVRPPTSWQRSTRCTPAPLVAQVVSPSICRFWSLIRVAEPLTVKPRPPLRLVIVPPKGVPAAPQIVTLL
jgi:hypothetical protein